MDAPRPLTLDRFAGISARLEVGLSRERVLAEAQISTEVWELTQETWLARLGAHAAQRKLGLQRRYGELLAAHRKAALLQVREERRKLSGPVPAAPITRVVVLALPPLGKADATPGPAPLMTAKVGGATADISSVVQQLLAGNAATPFARSAGVPAAAAPASPASPTVKVGGATADISSVVQQMLAGSAATPFAEAAKPSAPAPAPKHPGSETADISSVVQRLLAGQVATPFARDLPAPAPREAKVGAATEDISSVVQRVLASQKATPFAPTPSAPAVAAHNPSVADPGLPSHLPSLTLEHYAELHLQLWRDPARTAEILGLWRIRDAHSWAQLQAHWQRRLAGDAALAQRWTQVVAELKAARGLR